MLRFIYIIWCVYLDYTSHLQLNDTLLTTSSSPIQLTHVDETQQTDVL